MALTSEDIWQKFDLSLSERNGSQNEHDHSQTLESVLRTGGGHQRTTSISKIMDADSLVVPDIGDILSDANLDLDINLDGGIDMDFDYLLDDFLTTKEPLRHDCMWSGERDPVFPLQTKLNSSDGLDLPSGGNTAGNQQCSQEVSCFDTPLPSETSDLDETSSDLEGDGCLTARTSCADRLLPSPDSGSDACSSSSSSSSPVHFFSDHSYVATSRVGLNMTATSNTLLASNHDKQYEDGGSRIKPDYVVPSSTNNTFRIPAHPTTAPRAFCKTPNTNSNVVRPAKKENLAKFKFQVKFKSKGLKSTSSSSNSSGMVSSRSLLRSTKSPTNLTAKHLLAMSNTKSFQVSKSWSQRAGQLPSIEKRKLVDMINSPRLSVSATTANAVGETMADTDKYKKRTVRDMHNILERQRRIDLRNAFDTLKGHLPDLQRTDKASKIMILTRAAEYCSELTRTEVELRGSIRIEKINQQLLMKKLNQLKKKQLN